METLEKQLEELSRLRTSGTISEDELIRERQKALARAAATKARDAVSGHPVGWFVLAGLVFWTATISLMTFVMGEYGPIWFVINAIRGLDPHWTPVDILRLALIYTALSYVLWRLSPLRCGYVIKEFPFISAAIVLCVAFLCIEIAYGFVINDEIGSSVLFAFKQWNVSYLIVAVFSVGWTAIDVAIKR